jgi:hypothetical protein
LSERRRHFRTSSGAQPELLTEDPVRGQMLGAMSHECRTEPDCNNARKETGESNNMAADDKSQT